jgi:prepilin-type N-terminal cleavage/methylation domain-containing protein
MKNNGFTLIEIVVVATIISLLASVGLVTYAQFTKQSRDAKRKIDIETIRGSVELYRSNNDTYPDAVTPGGSICDPGGCTSTTTYMQKVPSDPKASTLTYYYTKISATDYTVGAYLEGGGSASCGNCSVSGTVVCNYCVGPYGEK